MELGKLIFAAVVFLIILIFIMFPEARTLFSGITRVFIKDMASTPEGAAAIYSEKIDQAQDRYNKADNAYRIAAGKLSNAQRDMKNLKVKLEKVESECESLVKANKMDLAQLKADEHEEIISDIERYKELIKAYEDAANTAKDAQEMCEKNLRKLKRESKEVVENMDHVMTLPGGAYNFGSETTQSMYEITEQFLQLLGKDVQLQDALPRHNLWMNCEKARKYGIEFSEVSDGLKRCLNDYKMTIKQ